MGGPRRPTVLLQLWTAAHMAERVVAARMEAAGVSDEQFALLNRLAIDGPVTPTALAAEMGVPLTTLADALRRLAARGEIERTPNPDDQRSYLVGVSPVGLARLQAADAAVEASLGAIAARLDRPLPEVEGAVDSLHDALKATVAEDQVVRKP
jgi:DNA-binding MarR family transcriptional regulator